MQLNRECVKGINTYEQSLYTDREIYGRMNKDEMIITIIQLYFTISAQGY